MRKILAFALLIGVLGLLQAASVAEACEKTATITYEQWPNGIVEVGEEVQWKIEIVIAVGLPAVQPGETLEDVVVKDNLGAELEIDYPGPDWYTTDHGYADYYTSGSSEKVHLTWFVGDLAYMEYATLTFYVSTDFNPAGKHEYTSPGTYLLNSGPTMKYYVNGVKHSIELNTIMITVYPRVV